MGEKNNFEFRQERDIQYLKNFYGIRTEPVMFGKEESQDYANRISLMVELATHQDEIVRETVKMIPEKLNGQKVIDIGCGEGRWSRLLTQRGADVTAIDNSESILEIARQRSKNSKISFKKTGVSNLENLKQKFNFGLAAFVFNNFNNLDKTFQDYQKIFKDQAELLITTTTFKFPTEDLKRLLKGLFLPVLVKKRFTMYTSAFSIEDYLKTTEKNNFYLINHQQIIEPSDQFANENLNSSGLKIEHQIMKYQYNQRQKK